MTRRSPAVLALLTGLAILISACQGVAPGPALTDPKAIVTAALTSTEASKSVHIDIAVNGSATVVLPGSTVKTPVDLSGTTAAADVDLAGGAARATFKVASIISVSGEFIAVAGKVYAKTSLTGPLYVESASSTAPVDPSRTKAMIETLGQLLLKDGVNLVKGDDVACGSKQCYTVTADLTAAQLGTTASGASGLPIDLTGATLNLAVRVEKDLPYHLAGIAATLTAPDATSIRADLTASKWDEPVSIAAPPADQVKPAS
ncbi:MAG TPA: LppX_LprAFG lipoprotein [Candidatus Limnocylindrales bacterium]